MQKRVVIVDFQHMVYNYLNSSYRASHTIQVGGTATEIDTTVQTGTIKNIHRWSKGGFNPTVVCFDSPVPIRRKYFGSVFGMTEGSESQYKGGRKGLSGSAFESIQMTLDILMRGGVGCIKGNNYEADDLVMACIENAKREYPGIPIDVITNDTDLLPLVDKEVSVFLRSKKGTFAVSPELEKEKYIQVTPDNFEGVVENLSQYKKFYLPYNTLLLYKLLRGDSSDNIKLQGISRKYPPKKFNDIVISMLGDGVNLSKIFRYGNDVTLNKLLLVLSKYVDEETLPYVEAVYKGINLNQEYNIGGEFRSRANLASPIKGFDELDLQREVSTLGINLKLFSK